MTPGRTRRVTSRWARIASVIAPFVATGPSGCSVGAEGTLAPAASPTPPDADADADWRVGAASIDITPPLGYGMAGHSLEGRNSVGVWTRLRAHAIAIEDRDGVPVVMVATDLWATPAALADRVTERLQTDHGMRTLGRAQLVLAATHTHHGPGHFSTAAGYAQHAGPSTGFDPVLFEWLAERIAVAAAQAFASRRPATLELHRVAVPTLARNRSLTPFVSNPEAKAILSANAVLPGCSAPPEASESDAALSIDPCHAIDPRLRTLVARDADGSTLIAVAGIFAMHPTAMPNRTEVYHADLFGVATQQARSTLRRAGHDEVVVAMFNGAEGDVSPNWSSQGRPATTSLGRALAEALTLSIETPGDTLAGTVGYGLARVDLSGAPVLRPTTQSPGTTGRRAIPGYGQFGGAEDGRTRFHRLGWKEGVTAKRRRRPGHGRKRPGLPPFALALAHPKDDFPSVVPVGLVQLGALSLITLPGEFTTVMGQRIERRVSEALGTAGPVVSIGLSGEYLSYFTTPEEYDHQHYEGASMLYGRLSGEAVAEAAESLATTPRVEGTGAYAYRARSETSAEHLLGGVRKQADKAAARIEDVLEVSPRAVSVEFDDRVPTWPGTSQTPTTPRVRVEVRVDGEWTTLPGATDEGDGFVTFVTEVQRERLRWRATWLAPHAPVEQPDARLRLRVTTVAGKSVCTAPFDRTQVFSADPMGVLPTRACSANEP